MLVLIHSVLCRFGDAIARGLAGSMTGGCAYRAVEAVLP